MPAVSKSQQRFMGMVCAAKKGKMKNPSPEVAKASASMSKDDACDFARTKHKGLPNKKVSKEQLSYDSIRNINVDSNDRDGDWSHFDRSTARMTEESNPRIPRKKGQPANSKKHSDLYTDENPKGTIHGLGFKDVATAKASVSKIRNSSRSHAHKIQAAVAMEQRAREMGKTAEAAVYRKYINSMKKKTEKKNLKEFLNFFNTKKTPPTPKPVPKDTKVLAYKNYKPGVLNKTTGEFTQRDHTPDEAARYGWKPVKTSSYGPGDTTSQGYNTGKDKVQRTADGTPFTGSTRGLAVPYKYKANEVPKGTWAGTPSVRFGTQVQLTQKPQGTSTRITNAPVRDTGNFGPAGEVNRSTSFDLMRQTARDVTGNQNLSPTQYGKRTLYSRIKDRRRNAGPTSQYQGPVIK